MATHSSMRSWRIPWTEEPGGLQSMESQRVGAHAMTCRWCSVTLVSLLSLASKASPTWSRVKPKGRLSPSEPWTRTGAFRGGE